MRTQRLLRLHPDKTWDFICTLYGAEIRQSLLNQFPDYEGLADTINKDFKLTPEQWEAILQNWEQLAWATDINQ